MRPARTSTSSSSRPRRGHSRRPGWRGSPAAPSAGRTAPIPRDRSRGRPSVALRWWPRRSRPRSSRSSRRNPTASCSSAAAEFCRKEKRMGERLPIFLPRIAVVVLVALAASAGLTFAAGKKIQAATPTAAPTAPRKVETIVVPDVRNQAFVFAKGQLEDLGFGGRVKGGVHAFAENTAASQSPPAGTKLINTGSPLIVLTLSRNGKYGQKGAPEDASTYSATAVHLADVAVAPVAAPKVKKAAPVVPAAPAPAKHTAVAVAAAVAPAARAPDFAVAGAR